jgi:hypothetical protein
MFDTDDRFAWRSAVLREALQREAQEQLRRMTADLEAVATGPDPQRARVAKAILGRLKES